MAAGKQPVSSSDSTSDSSSDSSEFKSFEETHDTSEYGKQKPAEENSPLLNPENDSDKEDSGSKDAGKGKQKLEEKGSPEDTTGSKDAPKAEKQRSGPVNPHGKDSAATPNAPKVTNKSSVRKRPRESEANQEGAKDKRLKTASDKKNAKQVIQRVWPEEDEIAILEGMVRYKDEMGDDPSGNMVAFLGYVEKSLGFDCSINQFRDKIRRLKEKYFKKVNKGDNTFANAHELAVFRWSKKVWGKEKVKKAPEVRKGVNVNIPVNRTLGVPGLEEEILSVGLALVEGPEKEALQKRWKSLRIAQLEVFLERKQIIADQAKLLLEHYKA